VVDLPQAGATGTPHRGRAGNASWLLKARAVVLILTATRPDKRISDEDLKPLAEGLLARALL
jgi:hypothetical protein